MYRIMTPGPTEVSDKVRMARSRICTNPDLDPSFVEEYKTLCDQISGLLHTKNETLILGGEGILGLEAAAASLTEPGDRALVLDNGEYGAGYADFVKMYGGEADLLSFDRLNAIDTVKLENFLKQHHDYKYASVVHGDTPSGVLNDISVICPLLKKYGILTIVDAVSTTFGEEIDIDRSQIDILCGGSQKVVSAPPGLSFVVISPDAKRAMHNRRIPIASFYANLTTFDTYYEDKWFPYTMPISDIYGLQEAIREIAEDPDIIGRHARIGRAAREAVRRSGLHLHLNSGYSNTVTVIDVPEGVTDRQILETMKNDYNIMLAGSFGHVAGKVIRIGHMGYNATEENMEEVFRALDAVMAELGVPIQESMYDTFEEVMNTGR